MLKEKILLPVAHVGRVWYRAALGYALYYFASVSNENWLPLLHWGAGISVPLQLALHNRKGRHRRRW